MPRCHSNDRQSCMWPVLQWRGRLPTHGKPSLPIVHERTCKFFKSSCLSFIPYIISTVPQKGEGTFLLHYLAFSFSSSYLPSATTGSRSADLSQEGLSGGRVAWAITATATTGSTGNLMRRSVLERLPAFFCRLMK